MKLINKLKCKLFGHKWICRKIDAHTHRRTCLRCGHTELIEIYIPTIWQKEN